MADAATACPYCGAPQRDVLHEDRFLCGSYGSLRTFGCCEIERLAVMIAQQAETINRLGELLKEYEWIWNYEEGAWRCDACRCFKMYGHAPDCRLAAELAKIDTPY